MSLTIGSGSETTTQALQSADLLRSEPPLATPTAPQESPIRLPVADGVARMLAAAGGGAAAGTGSGERELVASEDNITANPLGIDDAYDLNLYREADGSYTLELGMDIEFDFQTGTDASGNPLEWTDAEKEAFMRDYVATVEGSWDGKKITLDDGTVVTLDVELNVSTEPSWWRDIFTNEHWNVDVTKIPVGDFRQSSVRPGANTADLDSEDNNPADKGAGNGVVQYGTAHEFGHMIGLEDEYHAGHANETDSTSIMNRGNDVRDRHLQQLEDWVDGQI